MNRIAIECACRLTQAALHSGTDHLVILTSATDSDAVRRAVGTVMPHGSTSTGAIWTSPTGDQVSVRRYGDQRPAYTHSVTMNICNGGRVVSKQESQDVERWYEGGSKVVPFMGA
jgi:hypothetical protein